MPSAKQIKARKEFAKRVKRGDFRKAISKSKKKKNVASSIHQRDRLEGSGFTNREMLSFYEQDFMANSVPELRFKEKMIEKYKHLVKKNLDTEANPHQAGYPHAEWYKEYKKLGGKKSRREYDKNIDVFQEHTWDIFIHGDPSKYNSREEALEAVKEDLKIDNKELNLIFQSIDNVTAYT
tara:strand:+ start:312 stop:851 length:540 start_codon:yes stop_codon:yes gene_type:complete